MLEHEGQEQVLCSMAVTCTGVVKGNWPESQPVSICFLCLVSVVNKCVYNLHEKSVGFLQPHCQSHSFLNQLKALIFQVLDLRPGVPSMCLNYSLPKEDRSFIGKCLLTLGLNAYIEKKNNQLSRVYFLRN